jgi:hypothetical protein
MLRQSKGNGLGNQASLPKAHESWGAALAIAAGAGSASDSLASALVIDFLGKLSGVVSGNSVTLRNFTVVRYPAQANP